MSESNSSLKLGADYLIEKFHGCIKELNTLSSQQSNELTLILDKDNSISELKLVEISKKIRNLLKVGYVDGKERSDEYNLEGGRFYNSIQLKRETERFKPNLEKSIFLENVLWHKMKVSEFVDELMLIKESILSQVKISVNNYQTDEKPLEFDVSHEDHTGKIKVFISHKFVESDQKLADSLQKFLAEHDIYGQMAERTREYDIGWDEKIKRSIDSSDYLIAILTKNSLNSPSVHQEIGCARGLDVPVRILVEEEEVRGVLVQGKDSEKFSRKSFEKPFDNIVKDIIKKGRRKKNLRTNPELIRDVYRPLYNELSKVDDKAFLKDKLEDPWNTLDHYSQLKTDKKIKEKFVLLSSEIQQWNNMSVEKEREFRYKQAKITEVFKPCFEEAGLLKFDDIILSDTVSQKPFAWVDAFKDILLYEPNISDSQKLYEKLFAHAMLRDDEHSTWLKTFRRKASVLFDYLYDKMPEARKVLESEIVNVELYAQKNKIKSLVSELSQSLEEILK